MDMRATQAPKQEPATESVPGEANQLFERLSATPGRVLAAIGAVTVFLLIPLIAMAPTESASTEPDGPVFEARDRIDERFVSSVHPIFFIVEDAAGDLLRAEPLLALLESEQQLREELASSLLTYFDVETQREVVGILSLADLVDDELLASGVQGGLAQATDLDVKTAGAAVIDRLGEDSDLLALSSESHLGADGLWVIPAVTPLVLNDNQVLGFGNTSVNLGGDTDVEEYDRSVQDILRRADGLEVWGVAIDVNLTSQEQGAIAGPFIGLTVLAVLLIVGLVFRSYWVLATVASALLLLLVWLKGITNLIGLKDDLVLSLIVPIAMISFGVDFAFHAVGRYREERAAGRRADNAFVIGLSAVSGALVLALASDAAAFLSNTSAGIESIVQFGLGAAIALASAYVLLGIVAPLVVATIEGRVPAPTPGRRSTALRLSAALGASVLTMAAVLVLVFILPAAGAALAVVTIVAILGIPFVGRGRRLAPGMTAVGNQPLPAQSDRLAPAIGGLVTRTARRPTVVLPIAVGLSMVAGWFALQVPAAFDVEDFFSSDTDFVRGLDKVDEHVGPRGGEPALLYVEGDLTDPGTLARLSERIESVRRLETDRLARDADGIRVEGGIFRVFDAVWSSDTAISSITGLTGVEPTDDNGDGIPDTTEQVTALIRATTTIGVPFDGQQLALTPDDVRTSVRLGDRTAAAGTVFEFSLVNSRSQEAVNEARAVLEPIASDISADLGDSFVQITGSPFVRAESLDATNRALLVSLPIALLLCLTVASVFLRSLRFGLASIVPILMVVTWLYGFMELAGYAINIVTATIAAVSIGIGIDFALHYISRYREELERHGRRADAVSIASEGTGTALVASAVSSAVGFAIMAFAPMPLFAAYGLLTAIMIVMALLATLLVLPAILVLITADTRPRVLVAPTGRGSTSGPARPSESGKAHRGVTSELLD